MPTSVSIQFGLGVMCDAVGTVYTGTLNGSNVGTFTSTYTNCGCTAIPATVYTYTPSSLASYHPGALNTFYFTTLSSCFGFPEQPG